MMCVLLCAVVLIIKGGERGGGVENCLLGIAYFGIAYFGTAYFGIAYFGIAYFGIAYFGIAFFGIAFFGIVFFGTKESNCFLCGRLAYFEYTFILIK
jgi:hypothetical protein